MQNDNIIEYDTYLFKYFKELFSKKFKDKFSNEKLLNTWGRKCQFLFNFLKKLSKNTTKVSTKKAIQLLLDFLKNKEQKQGLEYFSSFNYTIFKDYKKEILSFRNMLAGIILKIIYSCEFENANFDLLEKIDNSVQILISQNYKFLIGLYRLLEVCFSPEKKIGLDFISIINNKDITKKIIENGKCTLNSRQKFYIINNQFKLNEHLSYLENLKNTKLSNKELECEILEEKNELNGKGGQKYNKNSKINSIECSNVIENIHKRNNIIDNSLSQKNNEINFKFQSSLDQNDDLNTKVKFMEKENNELKRKVEFLTQENNELKNNVELLLNENNEFHQKIELLNMELESLKSRFDESEANNNKNQNELQNRIDVLESIISMICYRDLIKEIINYIIKRFYFEYF